MAAKSNLSVGTSSFSIDSSAKILLIQASTLGLDTGKDSPAMPLSLVSAVNLVAHEFEVEVFDHRMEALSEDLFRRWEQEAFLCVGVTGLTGPEIGDANRIVRRIRERSSAPIVWGGNHATLFPQFLLEKNRADIVVIGEGEEVFFALCCALQDGRPLKGVPGLAFTEEDGDGFTMTEPAPMVDLNTLPELPYPILKYDYLFEIHGQKSSVIETSRGCPYHCKYCFHSKVSKGRWRKGDPIWCMERIQSIKKTYPSLTHLNIQDDNFFVDRHRNLEIAESMIGEELGITYRASGAVEDMQRFSHKDTVLLKRSGLVRVHIGIETMSPRLQEQVDKKQTPEEILDVCHRLGSCGIQVWGNILVGLPGESPEDLDHTLQFVRNLIDHVPDVSFSPFYIYTPYPGTAYYDDIVQQGYPVPEMEELEEVSWSRTISPWLTPKQRKFYGRQYFYTLFIDDKVLYFKNTFPIRIFHRIFKPIARQRVFRKWMAFPIEKWLFDHLLRVRY